MPPTTGDVTPAMRLQILSTEHWSLLASRSLAWNESFSRAGMFLTTLTGAIVALALVAQASSFGDGFTLFALVILPVVLLIGVATWIRLGASNYHEAQCVIGMNRIRAAYLEMAPDLAPYFVMGVHDDAPGVGITMAVPPGTAPIVHLIAGTPTLVMVLNAVVAGALTALVLFRFAATDSIVTLAGALLVAVAVLAGQMISARSKIRRGQMALQPMFPTPTPTGDETRA